MESCASHYFFFETVSGSSIGQGEILDKEGRNRYDIKQMFANIRFERIAICGRQESERTGITDVGER